MCDHEKTLAGLRAEIEKTDDALYALFARRMALSLEIGREKKALGRDVRDPAREKIVLQNARARAGEALAPYAETLCETLMRLSRAYQESERNVSE